MALQKKHPNCKLVLSDQWKSYKCLKRAGFNIDSVNHSREFVKKEPHCLLSGNNKILIKVHTNNIENMWSRLKRITKLVHGISRKHFSGVIEESLLLMTFKCYNRDSIKGWINILKNLRRP